MAHSIESLVVPTRLLRARFSLLVTSCSCALHTSPSTESSVRSKGLGATKKLLLYSHESDSDVAVFS